jgi:PAT family beta-lactamase induction signal transducer AmpG
VAEPPNIRPPETLSQAVRLPFEDFVSRKGRRGAVGVLAFVVLFRIGDALISNMATPFLIQTGFTQREIGVVYGGVGLAATIVGAFLGGALAAKLGLKRFLWIAGGLQALSNLAYLSLAYSGHNYALMTGVIVVENLCGGIGTAALVGFLITLCNPRFSATQYALLTSVMAVGRDVLASPAGKLAEMAGWSGFFLLTFVAALPALALLPVFAPWNIKPVPR